MGFFRNLFRSYEERELLSQQREVKERMDLFSKKIFNFDGYLYVLNHYDNNFGYFKRYDISNIVPSITTYDVTSHITLVPIKINKMKVGEINNDIPKEYVFDVYTQRCISVETFEDDEYFIIKYFDFDSIFPKKEILIQEEMEL